VVLGHNKFSDWTDAEYKSILNFAPHAMTRIEEPTILATEDTPKSIDWVELGAVNEM